MMVYNIEFNAYLPKINISFFLISISAELDPNSWKKMSDPHPWEKFNPDPKLKKCWSARIKIRNMG